MRFIIVSRAENVSGKEIMTLELGAGLRNAGHWVKYVTSYWNDGNYPKRLRAMGFEPEFLHLGAISATLRWDCLRTTFRQLQHLAGLWVDYRRILREARPEHVIHTSWHHLLVLIPCLSPERDWYWIHEVLPDKAHYRWFFQTLASRLRGFVAVSHAVRESLLKAGVPEHKVRVIHNGLCDIADGVDPRQDRDEAIHIGIVGQVEEWKGHHDLLTAFARIADRHPEARVDVYGSGSAAYSNRLKGQAAELGISDRVVWHGFVDQRALIYRELDLCVVPVPANANEALPTVAIEAGLFSLPVVASRRGGLSEIIDDGVTGYLVEPGNVQELAECLAQVLGDAELRTTLGRSARARVGTLFARERFIRDFVRLLDTVNTELPSPSA